MAESTRMKSLENTINDINKVLLKSQEDADCRHAEYMQHRNLDQARLDRVDNQLSLLHASSSSGGKNSQTTTVQPFQVRNIKLDFPRFDGSEVMNWIFRAKQFFDYYATPDNHRLTIAAVHMEKDVVPWFQMISRKAPFQSWTMFTRALEREFGPSPYESPRTALFKLHQTTTFADYYTRFTVLANRSDGLSPDANHDCFLSGLKPEIQHDVIAQTPTSLSRAFALAKLFEDKYFPTPPKPLANPASKPYHFPSPGPNTRNQPNPPLLPTPNTKNLTQMSRPNPIKNITRAEIQLRRENGLCYYCDDKFSMNHKCPNCHYLLLQVEEDEEISHLPDPPDPITQDLNHNGDSAHHLSMNALSGSHGAGTLRFQGQILGINISVLLDSGSSENFLQPCIAQCLKLPIQSAEHFTVLVGNGSSLTTSGYIADLPVAIQGHTLHIPIYLLPITWADLVLGAPWLKTLSPHIADYNALSITFYADNTFVTLYGERHKSSSPTQYHHIKRLHHTDAIDASFTLQCRKVEPIEGPSSVPVHPGLTTLLSQFDDIFVEPQGLPPERLHDNVIPLIEGSNPVKVHPYRYPQSQKAQIEKMVLEMLNQGIIQPSSSLFSSPVLLVKKKDGTWRFCTDYRALNAITIKDSFPISTVDELLDELYGAHYFSKLDLRSDYHQILVKQEDRHKTAFRTHHGFMNGL